jgi:hypothetical protein
MQWTKRRETYKINVQSTCRSTVYAKVNFDSYVEGIAVQKEYYILF